MDLDELITSAHELYVEQFQNFVADQRQKHFAGASEVKLQLSDESPVYRHLYCADFVSSGDGDPSVVELMPDRVLSFPPMSGLFGDTALTVRSLCWDDIVICHDSAAPPSIEGWFDTWFDPDDVRHHPDAELSGVIHSLGVELHRITADLGTAPADALWTLLELLTISGARQIQVDSSRAKSDPH